VEKEIKERNIPRPVRVGAMKIAGTGAVGMTEADTVSIAETSAKGMVKMGAIGAVGAAIGIFVSTATPGSPKVSAIKGMDKQNKGRPQQRGDTDTYV